MPAFTLLVKQGSGFALIWRGSGSKIRVLSTLNGSSGKTARSPKNGEGAGAAVVHNGVFK